MITVSGKLQNLNDTVAIACADLSCVALVLSGTAAGTVLMEESWDGGITWINASQVNFLSFATGNPINSIDAGLSDPGPYAVSLFGLGVTHIRVRLSVATSGSLQVRFNAVGAG